MQMMRWLSILGVGALLTLPAAPLGLRHDADVAKHDALYRTPAFRAVGRILVGSDHKGTGTLIRSDCVLTAGHVADLMVGGTERGFVELNGKKIPVRSVAIHPSHKTVEAIRAGADYKKEVDLALLFLDKPVTGIKPIPLHRGRSEKGKEFVAVGSGSYGVGVDLLLPNKVQMRWSAGTNVIDTVGKDCTQFGMPETALMADFDSPQKAGLSRMGSSKPLALEVCGSGGDSGGPWLLKKGEGWELAGAYSATSINSTADFLTDGVYGSTMSAVRISEYVNWIEAELKRG